MCAYSILRQQWLFTAALFGLVMLTVGCAQTFPKPDDNVSQLNKSEANAIFLSSLQAHGGDKLSTLKDLNFGLDGDWKFLITRIQPLVTDHNYRVRSQERLLLNRGIYSAHYEGPAGKKYVYRDASTVRVFYNGVESTDNDVLQSTALTADAFYLFLLGPLALTRCIDQLSLLDDTAENGVDYYRLHCALSPGFGFSNRDNVVIWVNKETKLTYRLHITLEGYRTTKGAHVDVTFRDYIELDGFTLPSKFEERVLGPIKIHAHNWHLTGADVNRGVAKDQLTRNGFSGVALKPAAALMHESKRDQLK